MRGFVVTLQDMPESVAVAERCIDSGREFGIDLEQSPAVTRDEVDQALKEDGLSVADFDRSFSDPKAVLANFMSQFRIWARIERYDAPALVCEHDAMFIAGMPDVEFRYVMNVGKPSYGDFSGAGSDGVHPLFSKRGGYFPGAHAYAVTPDGASHLINGAYLLGAMPCDMFLSLRNFPWLQELYPWIAEAHDSFSTIQRRRGCLAKHRFDQDYRHLP